MAGGLVGEIGVPVKELVLMKGMSPQWNFVKGSAPTPLRLQFHVDETVRDLTRTDNFALDYLSAQVIHCVFFH